MEIIQKVNLIPVKPRKVRFLVRQIKHWPLVKTINRLKLSNKNVASYLIKGLGSAVDRIKQAGESPENFIIKRVNCNESLKLKRRIFESRGRARRFTHQKSNLYIVIGKKEIK